MSVIGRSHAQQPGGHCQDAKAFRTRGSLLSAVVCDGAGSAVWSYFGANILSDQIAKDLIAVPSELRPLAANTETVIHHVRERIAAQRLRLIEGVTRSQGDIVLPGQAANTGKGEDLPKGDDAPTAGGLLRRWLRSAPADGNSAAIIDAPSASLLSPDEIAERLRCTLVGALLDDSGGVLFHIGDGLASAVSLSYAETGTVVLPDSETASPPENGEFANETYFATDPDWRDHLRFTVVGPDQDTVFLMTDGAAAFAAAPGQRTLFAGFANQLLPHLTASRDLDMSDFLGKVLLPAKVHQVTTDDATLVIAIRRAVGETGSA